MVRDMTLIAVLSILGLGAAVLCYFAGREALRINGFPPVVVRDASDALHVMSLGYARLNDAARKAAELRTTRSSW